MGGCAACPFSLDLEPCEWRPVQLKPGAGPRRRAKNRGSSSFGADVVPAPCHCSPVVYITWTGGLRRLLPLSLKRLPERDAYNICYYSAQQKAPFTAGTYRPPEFRTARSQRSSSPSWCA